MTRISPDKAGRWRCGAGQPASSAAGRKAGTPKRFEIVCCDCGDDPDLDYREVTPQLGRIRGPYPIAAGVAA